MGRKGLNSNFATVFGMARAWDLQGMHGFKFGKTLWENVPPHPHKHAKVDVQAHLKEKEDYAQIGKHVHPVDVGYNPTANFI